MTIFDGDDNLISVLPSMLGGHCSWQDGHLHMMFLDWVYASAGGGPRFYEQPEFHTETVMTILEMIYQRLMRLFAKKAM